MVQDVDPDTGMPVTLSMDQNKLHMRQHGVADSSDTGAADEKSQMVYFIHVFYVCV